MRARRFPAEVSGPLALNPSTAAATAPAAVTLTGLPLPERADMEGDNGLITAASPCP